MPDRIKVVSVKFRTAGKLYEFLHNEDLDIKVGEYIIVSLEKGEGIATVVHPPFATDRDKNRVYRRVLRKATEEDVAMHKANQELEIYAFETALHRVKKHRLPMKLVRAEYLFDASKITFYFTADGRVDFRELVKDLAQEFKTRIEMRQIGVRDETKLLGGFAPCGRTCCCSSFLRDFAPVSIRMAKEQNLNLSPSKISGLCGRLMCCLVYEHSQYEQALESMPKLESEYDDGRVKGTVIKLNPLKRTLLVLTVDGKHEEIDLNTRRGAPRFCNRCQGEASACQCPTRQVRAKVEAATPPEPVTPEEGEYDLSAWQEPIVGFSKEQAPDVPAAQKEIRRPAKPRSKPKGEQVQSESKEKESGREQGKRRSRGSRRSKEKRNAPKKGNSGATQSESPSPAGADSAVTEHSISRQQTPRWKNRSTGAVIDHSDNGK
ncbi:PSP1 domain-containing protein [Desulfurispira natronophila]|uniref:Cell fate regulator YaaT (PSP1 superfamily) n=1 Tax=Desulfurispira natronophila TaxID=682562 RepID=A0A7W7Y4Z0_9BACT|nr:stage 0 sporulation family protein [Desulfurispira natronophila]MBB5022180.1 cell fate regulator YaaT (PSP1 superfamily) [Desulfurispira natronophila]